MSGIPKRRSSSVEVKIAFILFLSEDQKETAVPKYSQFAIVHSYLAVWPHAYSPPKMAVAKFPHSHSGNRFRRHLNFIMPPPHCGQTRLMIDEMTLELDSPGSVSKIGMVDLRSLAQVYRRDDCATC
jgi:hypothetical protein